MIKRRCADEQWDDVVRKAAPDAKRKKTLEEVDDEKSKLGLGELYAKEYERQVFGAKEEEKHAAKHREVEALFAKVCNRLDMLSNFHYTPKAVSEEVTVRPNVPAISFEEKLPVGVSEAQALAPEEVYAKKKKTDSIKATLPPPPPPRARSAARGAYGGHAPAPRPTRHLGASAGLTGGDLVQGEGDVTSEDRQRLRNAKKRKHKKTMAKRKEEMRAQGIKQVDAQTAARTKATIKSGKEEAAANPKQGGLAKSSTLFSALQAEAVGAAQGMAGRKEAGGGGKEKKKHGASFKL